MGFITRDLHWLFKFASAKRQLPPFPGQQRFPEGQCFKQWTSDNSKALMKVFYVFCHFLEILTVNTKFTGIFARHLRACTAPDGPLYGGLPRVLLLGPTRQRHGIIF